uniref:G protein-coupled receptor class C group 5 member B n=1 Tax=Bos taurus TaxID=9913 RepID=A0AAA9T580_BOVIN
MRTHQALAFLLLFVIASGASENASTSRGCGLDLLPQYVSLCDLDTIWGIVVEAVAGAGALITLLLMLILLVRLPFIKDKEKKDPVGLHFLFLLGTLGLFGLTFAFIIREDETICSVRRFLWGVLFALCFSCLLSQAWRVRRLVRHGKSPSGWQLVGMALCLMLVQVIIAIEWLVLTVLRDAKPACAYEPMDFAMALIYDMVLLVATLALAFFSLCGKFKKWKQNGVCILVTAFLSVLIWVAWMTMYLFGNAELRQGDAWGDPTLAITLVASGWVFVIFHAIPEIHCTILPAPQENTPNYFDTSQPRMRETAFEEDVQLPRTYMENKAFSMDEHNAEMTPSIGLGPLRPLPRHFPRKMSDLDHEPGAQHLRLAHLCVYPETVLHSMVLNLTWMALSSEQLSELQDFAMAAWETDPALRSEATCISQLRWPLCSTGGLSQPLRQVTLEDTSGERL